MAHKPLPSDTHHGANGIPHNQVTNNPTMAHNHQRGHDAVYSTDAGLNECGPFMALFQIWIPIPIIARFAVNRAMLPARSALNLVRARCDKN